MVLIRILCQTGTKNDWLIERSSNFRSVKSRFANRKIWLTYRKLSKQKLSVSSKIRNLWTIWNLKWAECQEERNLVKYECPSWTNNFRWVSKYHKNFMACFWLFQCLAFFGLHGHRLLTVLYLSMSCWLLLFVFIFILTDQW